MLLEITIPDHPVLLVDARNVMRSQWPNIPERELVERVNEWAASHGVRPVIVFDGKAPPGAIGTGAESADDWLVREAAALRERGERVWLVTSDRELRRRAQPHTERITGGGSFADELRPRPRRGR
jgi:predicted RNA-binding protein with PIN domain